MSADFAMSGTFAAIFSFEASKKWIIREGRNGTSDDGLGRADGEGLHEVAWVSHRGRTLSDALACSLPPMEGRTLRPLGVGEILDASINLYFRNLGTFFKIAAVIAIPMGVIIFLLDQIAFAEPESAISRDLGIGFVGEYEQRVDLSTFRP